jgi:monoamine oxidase
MLHFDLEPRQPKAMQAPWNRSAAHAGNPFGLVRGVTAAGLRRGVLLICLILAAACEHPSTPSVDLNPSTQARVVVIGAGLAGLVAAYELEKRGISTHVLEMSDKAGGRVETIDYGNGLVAEAGLQELWQGNPLLDIAAELGVEIEDGAEAYSSVVIDGVLYPYIQPSTAEYFASFLSSSERAALDDWMRNAKSLYTLAMERGLDDPRIRALQEISFEDWIDDANLPERAATWIRLTLTCELATEWSTFSALFGLLEFHIFFDGGVLNYHVRGGNARLVDALAGAVRGPKTYSARVSRIERLGHGKARRVRVYYVRDRRIHQLEAERVVLAVPFTHLHRIAIEPPLSDAHWKGLAGLGLGQYVVVHLHMEASAESLWAVDGDSALVALTEGPLGVIYGPAAQANPHPDKLVFSLLVYGQHARTFHMAPQSAKLRAILAELERLFPGFTRHVGPAHVYGYHPAAVATWPPGRSPLDEQSELFRKPDHGLYFAGDWTLNAHSDGAAKSGILVAEQIAAEFGALP